MGRDKDYVEGSLAARLALLLLLGCGVGLFFFFEEQISQIIIEIERVSAAHPKVAIAMGNRLLLWLVVVSGGVSVVVGIYLGLMARQVRQFGRFPPDTLPVAFRTPVKRGEAALAQAAMYRWAAGLLCCQPLLGLGFWYWFTGGMI